MYTNNYLVNLTNNMGLKNVWFCIALNTVNSFLFSIHDINQKLHLTSSLRKLNYIQELIHFSISYLIHKRFCRTLNNDIHVILRGELLFRKKTSTSQWINTVNKINFSLCSGAVINTCIRFFQTFSMISYL